MNAKIKKGKLIVIEGTDGSGKQTQSRILLGRLNNNGLASALFSFPRYETPTGDIIRRYLGKPPYGEPQFGPCDEVDPKIASSFYALDRQAASGEIRDRLGKGINVICDRWTESNMAHQGGKIIDPFERNRLIEWISELEHGSLHIPRADLVVFAYMPADVSRELRRRRGEKEDGHESDPNHLYNAERVYTGLAKTLGWTHVDCAPNGTIESLRTIDDIGDEIYQFVSRKIQNT